MKGLFIPGITAKMFRDASVESVAELMTEGKVYDIDYQEPCEDAISRAEALKVVDDMDIPEDMSVFEIKSHIGVGIGTLPPVKPKLSENCISREDLKERKFIIAENDYQKGWNDALDAVYENASSIQQKKGRWITNFHGFPPEPTTVCSKCGFDRDFYIRPRGFDKIKFCPNCGEKKESEEK